MSLFINSFQTTTIIGQHINFEFPLSSSSTILKKYIIRLPLNYIDNNNEKFPLILFLHGSSSRGDDLNLVREFGLPKYVDNNGRNIKSIIVSPLCPNKYEWKDNKICEELINLIDLLILHYNIDSNRIYLTGNSMGGLGAWMLAARNTTKFAAIIPMCGGGATVYAKLLINLPIWFVHSKEDNVIGVEETDILVHTLKSEGAIDVQYTRYENSSAKSAKEWMIGHNCWEPAYADENIWNWLFSKSK
jgi:predicted peptidase